jgi:RNA polymerase sigma-70 factor (ECF subfamily)
MDKLEEKKQRGRQEDLLAVQKVLAGDNNAFKFLQDKYKLLINSLIRKMIKNEDDVDDLSQETFIKVYKSLNTFNPDYAFSSWLYKIASNTCIDFLRKKRFNVISISNHYGIMENEDEFELEDNSYLPDKNILDLERTKIITKAIEALPEKYKIIIKLRHFEDLDYAEIAEKLDLPLGTVKVNLFRARKMLDLALRKYHNIFDVAAKSSKNSYNKN